MHLKRQPAIGLLTYQYTDKNPRLPRAFQNAFEPSTSRFGAGDHFETVRISLNEEVSGIAKHAALGEGGDEFVGLLLDFDARSSDY